MHSHMDIQRATLRKWFAADLREMRRSGRRQEAREAVAKAHEIAKLAEKLLACGCEGGTKFT